MVVVKKVVVVVPCGRAGCCEKEGGGEGGEVLLLLLHRASRCEEVEVEVEVEVKVPLVPVPVLRCCAGRCEEEGEVVGVGVPLQEGLGGGYHCFCSHRHCRAAVPAANATLLYTYHVSKKN